MKRIHSSLDILMDNHQCRLISSHIRITFKHKILRINNNYYSNNSNNIIKILARIKGNKQLQKIRRKQEVLTMAKCSSCSNSSKGSKWCTTTSLATNRWRMTPCPTSQSWTWLRSPTSTCRLPTHSQQTKRLPQPRTWFWTVLLGKKRCNKA